MQPTATKYPLIINGSDLGQEKACQAQNNFKQIAEHIKTATLKTVGTIRTQECHNLLKSFPLILDYLNCFERLVNNQIIRNGVLLEYPTTTGFQWGHLKNGPYTYTVSERYGRVF